MLNVSGLVKKETDYDVKISEIEKKYFITSDYNKFTNEILDKEIKQKELVNKPNISNSDLNTKLGILETKVEFKAVQDKILKLQAFDSTYFRSKNCFVDDGFQKMFVYQSTFNTLELKKDKGT